MLARDRGPTLVRSTTPLGDGRIEVRSAGSMPRNQIDPAAIQAIAEESIDISTQPPKVLTTESVQASDV